MKYIFILLFISSAFSAKTGPKTAKERYCNTKNLFCPPRRHILCPDAIFKYCNKSATSTVSPQEILDAFNDVRNVIAMGRRSDDVLLSLPQASNMWRWTWDDELNLMLDKAMALCPETALDSKIRVCFNTERFPVMHKLEESPVKNLYDVKRIIDKWKASGENMSLTYGLVDYYWEGTSLGFADWSDFANIAWANTYKVACHADDKKFFCLFGPQKIKYQAMYWYGDPCSRCPYNTRCDSKYPNLCSRHDVVSDEAPSGEVPLAEEEEEGEPEGAGVLTPTTAVLFGVLTAVVCAWMTPSSPLY